jgi:hypothetical protein
MAQSRQTPRVWSDAIRGSEILSNWVKLGTSAVLLWLSIGIALGAFVGGLWFLEGTTSLDRKLWLQHVRNSFGIGGRIADLPNPDGTSTRIQVPKNQVRRYTWRSYQIVSRRFEESVFLGLLLTVGGTVTSAFFLRQSGRSATEDRHIRGATMGGRGIPVHTRMSPAASLRSGSAIPAIRASTRRRRQRTRLVWRATWVTSIHGQVRSLNSFDIPPSGGSLSSLEMRH